MKTIFSLFCLWGMSLSAYAATVMVSYSGGVDPTTLGWTKAVSTTNVVGSTYQDGDRTVWRIYDPGLGKPNPTDPANNLNYQKAFTNTQVEDFRAQGWIMTASVSIPTSDPTSGVIWTTGSDSWLGFIHANPDGSASRLLYGFNMGRTATGQTSISVSGLNGSTLALDPGYHELKMVFDPTTLLASVFVDDIFRYSYAGSVSPSTGSQVVYWGDNSSQTIATVPRSTYYESVSFVMVPEPQTTSLCGLACLGWLWYSRRRR